MTSCLKMGAPFATPASAYPPPYVRGLFPRVVSDGRALRMPLPHPPRAGPKEKEVGGFPNGVCNNLVASPKFTQLRPDSQRTQWKCHLRLGVAGDPIPSVTSMIPEAEGLVLNAVNMNFFERLSLAWRILFPTSSSRMPSRNSNANIAKQRLKMILFSDRCAVTEEAKQKIVTNIVSALSDFVEIDSRDKVQLSVSADLDLGTVYSVTIPVRRVKPEYRESEEEYQGIASVEYKDTGETSGCVDVKFDFFLPNE